MPLRWKFHELIEPQAFLFLIIYRGIQGQIYPASVFKRNIGNNILRFIIHSHNINFVIVINMLIQLDLNAGLAFQGVYCLDLDPVYVLGGFYHHVYTCIVHYRQIYGMVFFN